MASPLANGKTLIKTKPRQDKRRVLVTGGAGFVGSHLCTYLVNRGDHVICMDNFFTGPNGMDMARTYNVGAFGTARRQRAWLPMEYKQIEDDRFNTLYTFEDRQIFLIMRCWVDNKPVDFVSANCKHWR